MLQDFLASARLLAAHPECTDRTGVVGFCFGGVVANALAVRLPGLAAAVPFHGRPPAIEDVPRIQAPLLLHFAEDDPRVNEGWPPFEATLKAHDEEHEAHVYPGTRHGFPDDTTPRHDEEAAKLAWSRTVAFFREKLG